MKTKEQIKWNFIEDHIKHGNSIQFYGTLNSIHSGIPISIEEGPTTEPYSVIRIKWQKTTRLINEHHIIIPYGKLQTEEAIDHIMTLETLPPQIDYIKPYRIKANEAQQFINSLSKEEQDAANKEIEKKVYAYNDSGAAQYDKLF